MPMVALNAAGDEICILNYDNPQSEIDEDGLHCKHCGEDLLIRVPSNKLTHFCHYPSSDCSATGESVHHILGKHHVAEIVKKRSENAEVHIEKKIGVRRADVLVIHAGGQQVAHEIQVSSIPKDQIKKRSVDYMQEGVSVYWWFGSRVPKSTKQWAVETFGGIGTLEFETAHEVPTSFG